MKGIEPGCMVMVYGLVVDVEYNGLCGIVEGYYGPLEYRRVVDLGDRDYVEIVNKFGGWVVNSPSFPEGVDIFYAKNLLRIDDPDLKEEADDIEKIVEVNIKIEGETA